MSRNTNAITDSYLIAEYIDEGGLSNILAEDGSSIALGKVQHPKVVGDYLDLWTTQPGKREFIVLLNDGRKVTVAGDGLSILYGGEYGVVVNEGDKQVLVAVFRSADVQGVFCGTVTAPSSPAKPG